MEIGDVIGASELSQLALRKMTSVLGAERARQLMTSVLTELRLSDLESPDDLFRFAGELSKLNGFEAAVGAMLGVTAVMRGASGR